MSGTVTNNTLRDSGGIAATAAGLNWVSTVVTGSTVTVESGNGYWINTTSNTCTITLPSSAEKGDQIVFIDYARTWGTNKIIIDSNGLKYQGKPDTDNVEYNTNGQAVNIVYSDATKGWIPLEDDATALEPVAPATQRGIFAFGGNSSGTCTANLVNSSGAIAADNTIAGTPKNNIGASTYGGDKAIFAFGENQSGGVKVNVRSLVSNSGVVASEASGAGTARMLVSASTFGTSGQAIFAYGATAGDNAVSMSNLVNNSGVIASDVSGVGTGRRALAAARYGVGLAIFGYGIPGSGGTSLTNKVNNVGVVASDTTGVGTARSSLAATAFGGDKAIFGYGESPSATVSVTNKVSNTGVVASDVSGVGTARYALAATDFGGDKGVFFGGTPNVVSISNLVSNTGVVASNTSGAGGVTGKHLAAGAGYSFSA